MYIQWAVVGSEKEHNTKLRHAMPYGVRRRASNSMWDIHSHASLMA
jgi:hypothetical protein